MTFTDRVFNKSCEAMDEIPSASIDLVVTSPPYDAVRQYEGFAAYNRAAVIGELWRVIKDGGAVCWVIQDQTKDFAKSDTSFRTALEFADAGFRRFETIVYQRHGRPGPWWNQRLRVDHEYCHVFFKGARPKAFTKPMVPAKWAGHQWHGTQRLSSGETERVGKDRIVAEDKCRGTIWDYGMAAGENNEEKSEHPATFPDALACDLIRTFSNEGDIILDPFMGSGTTAAMAEALNRYWLGYEINPTYCGIIERRVRDRNLFKGGVAQ